VILQLVREFVLPGHEDEYRQVESGTARACAALGCPHPHLALETVEAPMEVWWLNLFESDDHRQRVTRAYVANVELMRALGINGERKARITGRPFDIVTRHRPDLSEHRDLGLAGIRFLAALIVVVSADTGAGSSTLPGGIVFDADDGTRLTLAPGRSEAEVRAHAPGASIGVTILEVQPRWGVPAPEWIAADPEFWTVNPSRGVQDAG